MVSVAEERIGYYRKRDRKDRGSLSTPAHHHPQTGLVSSRATGGMVLVRPSNFMTVHSFSDIMPDRSNGFEKKYFQKQNERRRRGAESYEWSVDDM